MVFKIFFFCTIIVYFSATATGQSPTITNVSKEQIRDVGGQVDLDCSVDHANEYAVIWQVKYNHVKPAQLIPLSANSELMLNYPHQLRRLSIRRTNSSETAATYTLSIKDIEENDSGLYQCQLLISYDTRLTANVELRVRSPSPGSTINPSEEGKSYNWK